MKYSFVLIAYNEAANIIACIQSIEALRGLGTSYEIVVVDDGSRDATPQLVSDYAAHHPLVRLIGDGANHGRGYGRYSGVTQTSSDHVVMVDADIVLPSDWLITAEAGLLSYDMAGGIAVPDGDVAFIYRKFHLQPKTVMGSTTITGNNGLYKRQIFKTVNFNPSLREGEDVDFNHRAQAAGFTAVCIDGLTVEHQEHKSLSRSMLWLYQSGIGATRQLFRFKQIRLPDLAFGASLLSFLAAIGLSAGFGAYWLFIIPLLGVCGAALLHMRSKFYYRPAQTAAYLSSLLTDSLLISCYYVGRFVGLLLYRPARSSAKVMSK